MINFIICELNPFHNGHAHLLSQIGEGPKVCIMSSHVTQRGDLAFTDKWTRTRMALAGGADLVLELSAPFAMGNAQLFAEGAVAIAKATGLKGRFCFGTEGKVLDQLQKIAAIPDTTIADELRRLQRDGYSYASAMTAAVCRYLPEAEQLLATPNNVLALEYLRAADGFDFLAIERKGVEHNAKTSNGIFCSASALRNNISAFENFVPVALHPLYREMIGSKRIPDPQKKGLLWLHALRMLSAKEWDAVAPDGIGRRFFREVQTARDIDELLSRVKTKCCTHASLRRLAMKGFLGLPPVDTPQYLRVLGANVVGRKLLSEMNPTLPLLTKPASVSALSDDAVALMEYESRLTDHFAYILSEPLPKGLEFTTSPIIL